VVSGGSVSLAYALPREAAHALDASVGWSGARWLGGVRTQSQMQAERVLSRSSRSPRPGPVKC